MRRIYLDHAATAPLLPEAREAMLPWLDGGYGNPSSLYEEGRRARQAIDESREALSRILGCEFGEVLFTSSGTEAANAAIVGAAFAGLKGNRRRVLFSSIEHHCVLHTADTLERLGFTVEMLPVDADGILRLDALERLLADDVLLVSVMHANNEIGTVQPVERVAELAHAAGALVHCDAVQTFTVLQWHVSDVGADLVSLSAHKIGGPKGAGAMYLRAGVKVHPLLVGGGQEREMRAGTENVAGIVGFGVAARTARFRTRRDARDRFVAQLREALPEARLTVPDLSQALPGHVHLRIPGISAESALILLDRMGVSASSGAACSSGSLEASHVLLALGWGEAEAREGLRFTFGADTTVDEADEAARRLAAAAQQIKQAGRRS